MTAPLQPPDMPGHTFAILDIEIEDIAGTYAVDVARPGVVREWEYVGESWPETWTTTVDEAGAPADAVTWVHSHGGFYKKPNVVGLWRPAEAVATKIYDWVRADAHITFRSIPERWKQ